MSQTRRNPMAMARARHALLHAGLDSTVDLEPASPAVDYDLRLTVDGQMLDIAEPFIGTELPDFGPIVGAVRAVGDTEKARVEITDVQADRSTLS